MTGGRLLRRDVPTAFDRHAAAYDRLVGANPGYHADLRRAARAFALPAGGAGARLLDVGCGTGASTVALLAAAPHAEIIGVDASPGMLARARAKPWPATVRFVEGRVEDLPAGGVGGPFDGVFAAYLVRNLPAPDAALPALRSLLRPGGVLVVHDYALRDGPVARLVWHAVCWGVIIPAGRLATGDARLYRYLWRSALDFDSPEAFADRLRRAGLIGVQTRTAGGWQRGIVHTFRAEAPS
ncbi:class I SAM-dependent methyltransferase [Actinoallomurus purpureus]|uniref:class I SAM-dependent methyltransferase n=1 Tax=Actinoallomurus purpureus TaxID=478114 RepID=UPI002092D630|nr:class I SAM-dependent methyltransferase [Actinoallomurus purpureus]MCO6008642.1 class I SAM-dependent methyltransferase [Actinoallomurus purpureus]